jgi:hypothetical protein
LERTTSSPGKSKPGASEGRRNLQAKPASQVKFNLSGRMKPAGENPRVSSEAAGFGSADDQRRSIMDLGLGAAGASGASPCAVSDFFMPKGWCRKRKVHSRSNRLSEVYPGRYLGLDNVVILTPGDILSER